MFDHIKVDQNKNQNGIENLLTSHEKDQSKNSHIKSGNDFLSMLMEQMKVDAGKGQPEQVDNGYKQNEFDRDLTRDENQYAKISGNETRAENTYNEDKDAEGLQHKNIDETEEKIHKEIEKEKTASLKEVHDKKSNKLLEEENIIAQLQSESSIKKLMEIVKALLNGDKKSEDDSYKKLKFNNDKSNRGSDIKTGSEGDHKNFNEIFGKITKELKEGIRKELHKVLEDRRYKGKQHNLTDKDLKDVVSNVIERVKKSRGKDLVKHEANEIKNDRKNINPTEPQIFRKVELSDSSHFEKYTSGDKNPDRENLNYNSSKTDFSTKSELDKLPKNMKMPDFKENLQEIIDKAKITVRDSRNGTFTVRLNPQELGSVNVNLIMKNGIITGKLLVDNEDVKNLLLNNLQELKLQLTEAGIEVGEFNVGVDSRHERNFSGNGDELYVLPSFDSDREIASASQIYNSVSEMHIGHINMII
ncbi:MAG: flagellar hook-length control protein FliK [Leptospirales bacterium]|nr:flagellar hook-length control protein FliK [Leptospirales bacterium]